MASSSFFATLAVAAVGLSAAAASDQANRVPVGIRLTLNSAEARLGARVPVVVTLKNFNGESVPTAERMVVALESNLRVKIEPVVIPPGKDSVTVTVIFERAGMAKLKASSGRLSRGMP